MKCQSLRMTQLICFELCFVLENATPTGSRPSDFLADEAMGGQLAPCNMTGKTKAVSISVAEADPVCLLS